jgi:HD-like signal output (HDOD) protein
MGSQEVVPNPVINSSVRSALDRARNLPSVPAVALEVMRVARGPQADSAALAQALSLDPALAAKVLRMANSALMGTRTEIVTLQQACTRLGFNTVKLWALSFVMVDAFAQFQPDGFDHDDYWKRSVFRAVSAKLVAAAVTPKLADEAFLTGLLAQVGQLVLAFCLPQEFDQARKATKDEWPSLETQRGTLGFTTDELGAALLSAWGLPDVIYHAVLGAQDPRQLVPGPSDSRDVAHVLTVASHCETLFAYGLMAEEFDPDQFAGTGITRALVDLYESANEHFGLDEKKVEQVLSGLDEKTEEIAEVLHVNLGARMDSSVVLREAQQQLLREAANLLRDTIANEQPSEQLEFLKLASALKSSTKPD